MVPHHLVARARRNVREQRVSVVPHLRYNRVRVRVGVRIMVMVRVMVMARVRVMVRVGVRVRVMVMARVRVRVLLCIVTTKQYNTTPCRAQR